MPLSHEELLYDERNNAERERDALQETLERIRKLAFDLDAGYGTEAWLLRLRSELPKETT